MNAEAAIAWLYGRQSLGIKLGLDKVRRLLAAVGDPQDGFRSIHVAGTNGKGSVTTLMAATLRNAGHRVGHTTSPHLVHFRERIQVDGASIDDAAIVRHVAALQNACLPLDAEGQAPTFFELVTALAFLHFQEAGVDWAVVETGLGGRLDATNVLAPELTIITNVGRDHVGMLGDTPQDVAYEKGGIMKPGVPCVTAAKGPALEVLKAISRERRVPMSILGEDHHVVPELNGFRILRPDGEAHFDLKMAGAHQIDNAGLVVAATEALRQAWHDVPHQALATALAQTTLPGRMETLLLEGPNGHVPVLLDGAHNEDGAAALRRHLADLDWAGFDLIVGFQADKDWPRLLEAWQPIAARGWGVPLRSGRTLDPERMRDAFDIVPFQVAPDARAALQGAVDAGAERIVVAGSLWLVGEARAALLGQGVEEIRGDQ